MVGNVCLQMASSEGCEDHGCDGSRGRRWRTAMAEIGYRPRDRRESDDAFWEGMAAVRSGACLATRVDGAELVIGAWFDRSLSMAIEGGYWRNHPDRDRFAAMLDLRRTFPSDVVAALRERYGDRLPGIPTGRTAWLPDTVPSGGR